ncbi:MAG: DUF5011 domain-containing protein [Erysipelotrichaceae bacterium]|nr:DUF5011 domain-containing protein [Erysipelotrichaceae bacterium]
MKKVLFGLLLLAVLIAGNIPVVRVEKVEYGSSYDGIAHVGNFFHLGNFHLTTEETTDTSTLGDKSIRCTVFLGEKQLWQQDVTYKVVDTTPPQLIFADGQDAEHIILNVGEKSLPDVSASDNYDGDLTDRIVVEGDYDLGKCGSYTVHYAVKDSSDNHTDLTQIIEVKDMTAPELTISTTNQYAIIGETTQLERPTAIDNADGDISDRITASGEVDLTKRGVYEILYAVSDEAGNRSELKVSVNVQPKNTKGIPVVMYHWFYDDTAGEKQPTYLPHNQMAKSTFEREIKYLVENNFYFCSYEQLLQYINGEINLPEHTIILTDDDSSDSFYRVALPVLEKYNVVMTEFIITSKDNWQQYADNPCVDMQSHSNEMHEVASRNPTKGRLLVMSYDELVDDLNNAKKLIEDRGGHVVAFAYPYGHNNTTAQKALQDTGHLVAFTTEEGRVKPGSNPMKLPRVRMRSTDSLSRFISLVN